MLKLDDSDLDNVRLRDELREERARAEKAEALLRTLVEYGQGDVCPICGELLDHEDNDLGDGELLGHTLDCPLSAGEEHLAGRTTEDSDE